MAFKMKGFSGFKKADPPKIENDNMAIIHMMIQDGASYDEIQNFANNAGNPFRFFLVQLLLDHFSCMGKLIPPRIGWPFFIL